MGTGSLEEQFWSCSTFWKCSQNCSWCSYWIPWDWSPETCARSCPRPAAKRRKSGPFQSGWGSHFWSSPVTWGGWRVSDGPWQNSFCLKWNSKTWLLYSCSALTRTPAIGYCSGARLRGSTRGCGSGLNSLSLFLGTFSQCVPSGCRGLISMRVILFAWYSCLSIIILRQIYIPF